MSDTNILDMAEFIDRIGGDKEFAVELLQEFRDSLDAEVSALKGVLESGDAKAITEKAHSIKGSALNLSAKGLAEVARTMEEAGKQGDVATAANAMPNLASESEKLKEAINNLS